MIPRSVPQPVISKEISSNRSFHLCRNHSHVVCGGSKLEVSPRFHPFEFKESCGSGGRKLLRGRGDRGQQEQRFWIPKEGTYELTGTEARNTGPAWVCNRASAYMSKYYVRAFVRLVTVRIGGSLFLFYFTGLFFFPVGLTWPTSI